MPVKNKAVNGDFETGSLVPWISTNVTINNQQSHSGTFSALLFGTTTSSLMFQTVPVTTGDSFEFFLSIAKIGNLPSPQVNIAVIYVNAASIPISIGMSVILPVNHLPNNLNNDWITIYNTTSVVPEAATQAMIIIHKIPAPSTADIVVDDIALIQTGGGTIGATGTTGAT
ncbi:NTTRR-F1 domain, partial [Brevibacillus laterosporus]|uniref:NTTRR-F1 domain n=1 Tax=Brevibacillus laterosporus TaxID=1465 RepID=UPI002E1A9549|nr:NTTRR-F1 domain [Brevibacillus laterosporus]